MHPVTLTTDFGTASPYVAAMKGVILSINPDARIHDLSHSIPPQNVGHAAQFLAAAVPFFPAGSIHVCVVDPGVGTERAALLAEAGGQFLLAPDNGCLTPLLIGATVRRLAEPKSWRVKVSATFHGRDVFAPAAAHLSRGARPADFGPILRQWVRYEPPAPKVGPNSIRGEVAFIDDFGNLITNIPADMVRQRPRVLQIGRQSRKRFGWVRTYGEAKFGTLVALFSSDGRLEIAVVNGSAAERLQAVVGTPVIVGFAR
ncbi:MAG: S-adenosyl-l-methionine hydroxide adenosyltransferase family protein [Gemmataceae bacterium]